LAASDILNPTPTHPLNPDYGWQKKRPVTHITVKAAQGAAYYREMTDLAHQFLLNWGSTPDCQKSADEIARIKYFYEQFRDGFFTLIDHEGGGRHYVGRFTTPVEPIPVGHNRWAAQGVLFEEVPGATMLTYPNRWDKDAIWRYVLSDFGELKVALSGNWAVETNSQFLGGHDLIWAPGQAGDWAQMAYVGYGFQFWARTGSDSGIADLYLDGTQIATLDQYTSQPLGPRMLYQQLNTPLGQHVVKLVMTDTKNPASGGYYVIWNALKVMR
jgi:hypothetical protein